MKVLIADKIDESSFKILTDHGINYDYSPDISPKSLFTKIGGFDALLVRSRTKVTSEIIDASKNLLAVGRVGSGVDNIDIGACREKGIIVVNAPGANARAVAEHVLGLALSFYRNIPKADAAIRRGDWLKKSLGGNELYGKTVGLVGFGKVGRALKEILDALGVGILIWSRSKKTSSLKELFEQSDIISIHLALNNETKDMIDMKLLAKMKNEAIFINTSRGGVVKEDDLYKILSEKKIKGACLDVFWQEPLGAQSKWTKLENVLLTPHIAGSTKEALKKASQTVISDIVGILAGKKPKNKIE